jgi:hypothetical protein
VRPTPPSMSASRNRGWAGIETRTQSSAGTRIEVDASLGNKNYPRGSRSKTARGKMSFISTSREWGAFAKARLLPAVGTATGSVLSPIVGMKIDGLCERVWMNSQMSH